MSGLCKCQRRTQGLQVDCTNVDLDNVVDALEESGEQIQQLKIFSSDIQILRTGAFRELQIKELNLAGNNITTVRFAFM